MERGFSAIAIILAVLVSGGVLFSLESHQLQTIVNQQLKQAEAGILANVSISQDKTSITPTKEENKVENRDIDIIIASGAFQFSDNKVLYSFKMPKNGGPITGNLQGVCQGAPEGNFEGGENGKLAGVFKARCTTGPLNLINVDIEINFTGTVNLKENNIYMLWEMVKPVSGERGSFNLDIQ